MASSTQPNTTLYVNNLNDKVNKQELRLQLYALFTTYGKVLDVVALKGKRMKGQAFLVFGELAAATSAMRALEGMSFYDKPLRIQYAKTKSYATLRREDPNFVAPTTPHGSSVANLGDKRAFDGAGADGRQVKKEKAAEDEEEMEMDDDDD